MHLILLNRLGGLSLSRNVVIRLTDRPDMTIAVAKEREKKGRNDRREKNIETTPPAPTASAISP